MPTLLPSSNTSHGDEIDLHSSFSLHERSPISRLTSGNSSSACVNTFKLGQQVEVGGAREKVNKERAPTRAGVICCGFQTRAEGRTNLLTLKPHEQLPA